MEVVWGLVGSVTFTHKVGAVGEGQSVYTKGCGWGAHLEAIIKICK